MGGPEGLNTHAHTEQPQPQKCCFSIHTSVRMTSLAQPRDLVQLCSCEDGGTLVLSGPTATTEAAIFPFLDEVLKKFLTL
jgi:hypothetical protein